MSQYYYTGASLPFLDFESDPPFPMDEFLLTCKRECTKRDFSLLEEISLIPADQSAGQYPLVDNFYAWERSLRNELVLLRAKKKGIDPGEYLQEGKGQLEPVLVARSAFQNESPLAAEKILSKARWMYLDNLEIGHYFDLEKLIVYKLKLEILIQKAQTNEDRGREMYKTIMEYFENTLVSLESKDD
ncbi:MAG: DUF2764 family protein [Spirochaetales bacterium]|nr:DUF2764 family protein [Spirochaetales bacterium]